MARDTKTFIANNSLSNSNNNGPAVKFVAKIANTSVNKRVTISSNFSVAKVKK